MIPETIFLRYLEQNLSPQDDLLDVLEKETFLKTVNPRMISGKVQVAFLSFLCRLIQPKTILEIGTFTGYATIAMAKALPENGKIYSIDHNPEWQEIAKKWIKKADVSQKVELLLGEAQQLIPDISVEFDMVFIDGEKSEYLDYYKTVFPKVSRGGIILADNVLWGGKIFDKEAQEKDKKTRHILKFNQEVQADMRVRNFILPIRDGLMVIEKIKGEF